MIANRENIGHWLRSTRRNRKVRQGALALQIGVHRNTLHRWEGGDTGIQFDDLMRVCDALGYTVSLVRKEAL